MKPVGWGYAEVGWLLDKMREAGGVIPSRYSPTDDISASWKPAREARLRFGASIADAFAWERTHADLTSGARAKQRDKRIASLPGQITRLLRAIDDDPVLKARLRAEFGIEPETRLGLFEVVNGLRRLEEMARSLQREWADGTAPLDGLGMTAQELLFHQLAIAYREGLDSDPVQGLVKTYNAPGGPFVAFVRAAFTLAEKPPPTGAALYKALQRTGFIGPSDKP